MGDCAALASESPSPGGSLRHCNTQTARVREDSPKTNRYRRAETGIDRHRQALIGIDAWEQARQSDLRRGSIGTLPPVWRAESQHRDGSQLWAGARGGPCVEAVSA